MSVCLAFESWWDYPGIEFRGVVSKLGKRILIRPCVFTFSVISRRRFAENGKEMYRNKKKLVKGVQGFAFVH